MGRRIRLTCDIVLKAYIFYLRQERLLWALMNTSLLRFFWEFQPLPDLCLPVAVQRILLCGGCFRQFFHSASSSSGLINLKLKYRDISVSVPLVVKFTSGNYLPASFAEQGMINRLSILLNLVSTRLFGQIKQFICLDQHFFQVIRNAAVMTKRDCDWKFAILPGYR